MMTKQETARRRRSKFQYDVYLASPFTSPDPRVRLRRWLAAAAMTAWMMQKGFRVYSPIAASYSLALVGLPGEWAFWRDHDAAMLDQCQAVRVVMLDGYTTSIGVQEEVLYARNRGKPVEYVSFPDELQDVIAGGLARLWEGLPGPELAGDTPE